MATKNSSSTTVEITGINLQTMNLRVIGDTPLITHRWSEKAKRMMLDKQMGKAVGKKEAKDPEADYESSIYRMEDGSPAFPAAGFKAATVGACRQYKSLPMTTAKLVIFIHGEINAQGESLVKINGAPKMREDMVRLETGVADIRYRAQFWPWSADLRVTFNANVISAEQVINLLNAGGMGGIGEWRPSAPKSSTGDFGRYHVEAG